MGEAGSKPGSAGHRSQWITLPSVWSCSSNPCFSTQVVSAQNNPTRDGFSGLKQEGNWIFTFHTSKPDSCWFHLGKLPRASAEVRVQCTGKFPSSISWEQEQPTAGADLPGKPSWLHRAPTMEHRPALIRSFQAAQEGACTALLHKLS